MSFDEKYFRKLKYSQKERLIRRHILDVLEWGSRISNRDLLNGAGNKALDVGCAYGYAVDILESFGYSAYGVDISRHGVKEAKRSHSTDFLVCDVQGALPFEENIFDLITCFGVLEHLMYPLQALKNMYASCRGIVICTTPNRLVEKPIKKIIRDLDETHINVKSQKEWESLLDENLDASFAKVEPVLDASLRVKNKLLFFRSLRMPYFGLDLRILIKK